MIEFIAILTCGLIGLALGIWFGRQSKHPTDPRTEIYENAIAYQPRSDQLDVLKSLHTHGLESKRLTASYLGEAREYAENWNVVESEVL